MHIGQFAYKIEIITANAINIPAVDTLVKTTAQIIVAIVL